MVVVVPPLLVFGEQPRVNRLSLGWLGRWLGRRSLHRSPRHANRDKRAVCGRSWGRTVNLLLQDLNILLQLVDGDGVTIMLACGNRWLGLWQGSRLLPRGRGGGSSIVNINKMHHTPHQGQNSQGY